MLEALDISDKVAVVTGGGSGLGREAAKLFAKNGADVVVAGRRVAPIEETANLVEAAGRKALAISTDVTDSSQVNNLIDRTVSEFGKIDILVNNAGVSGADDSSKQVWEITDEAWRRGIDGDLSGSFYCARAAGKYMVEANYGKIVNISSGFGYGAMRGLVMYSVAKAGVIHLTRVLAMQRDGFVKSRGCLTVFLVETTMALVEDNAVFLIWGIPDETIGGYADNCHFRCDFGGVWRQC